MRATTLLIVLAIHVALFLLFAMRTPVRAPDGVDAPATTFIFLPEAVKPVEYGSAPSVRRRVRVPVPVSPAPQPEPPAGITPTPAPDWRAEASIAANNVLEAERRKREQPSVLEPHDFSGVTPGSTDTSKPRFGWSYAATHRVQGSPGAFLINVNDRCTVAILLIFPMVACGIGHIPTQGNLFEHMHDVPDPKAPNAH